MCAKLVINNSKKIDLVDELYDKNAKYIKFKDKYLELTQNKALLTETPPYIKVTDLKDNQVYYAREVYSKTIKFVFDNHACHYRHNIIEVEESSLKSDRFNEFYQYLFNNLEYVDSSHDYHNLWVLEDGTIFDEEYIKQHQFKNNEEIKLTPLMYNHDEYDTTPIPSPEECDYYFETLEDYQNRINDIIVENKYYLHEKTLGFGPSIASLYTMSSNIMGPLFPETLKSFPKMLVSNAVKSIQHLGGNPLILRAIPSTLFKGLTEIAAITKGRLFPKFTTIKNPAKELPKIKIPSKLLYNSTFQSLQGVFEYLNVSIPNDLFNPENKITNISSICQNVYGFEYLSSAPWNILRNLTNASYAFSCEPLENNIPMLLQYVDKDLFEELPLTNVSYVLSGQSGIISELPELWKNSKITNSTGAFKSCINASNYSEIPEGYK